MSNDFWEYDTTANEWTQKANFGGTVRDGATGFAIGTKGYIGIGDDSIGSKSDFWEYDQGNNTWTQKANFSGGARSAATGFAIGTKGYIGIGYDGSDKNDFWEYTPDSINGIEELNTTNTINIYPNPLASYSILQLDAQLTNAEMVIYDMVGKVMMRRKFTGKTMEIKKGGMGSGVYFVSVKDGEKQWVKKMVVE
jgi:N-acetylneuraminic acid mutarotase